MTFFCFQRKDWNLGIAIAPAFLFGLVASLAILHLLLIWRSNYPEYFRSLLSSTFPIIELCKDAECFNLYLFIHRLNFLAHYISG